MKQAIQKLERPDIILIDLARYHEDKGKAKGRRAGRREGRHEGKLDVFALMFERRLGRALTDEQRAEIERRLDALGPERLGDVVLDLSARKLAAWLADPNSR